MDFFQQKAVGLQPSPATILPENPSPQDLRYEFTEKLGKGGAATVFKAWDHLLRRYVAFKRLEPCNLVEGALVDAADMEAFYLAGFEHPNIVSVYDAGIDSYGPFIVTNYVAGHTLRDFVHRFGAFRTRAFTDAVRQMLSALVAAHYEGLVHRDLKPGNIMVTQLPCGTSHFTLLDFGLARVFSENAFTGEEALSVTGSAPYLAPEQIRGGPPSPLTDLYSMGCVLYFMLTGRNAVSGKTTHEVLQKHLSHEIHPVKSMREDVPEPLEQWIMKLLCLEPEKRHASAKKALESFNDMIEDPAFKQAAEKKAVFKRFSSAFQTISIKVMDH